MVEVWYVSRESMEINWNEELTTSQSDSDPSGSSENIWGHNLLMSHTVLLISSHTSCDICCCAEFKSWRQNHLSKSLVGRNIQQYICFLKCDEMIQILQTGGLSTSDERGWQDDTCNVTRECGRVPFPFPTLCLPLSTSSFDISFSLSSLSSSTHAHGRLCDRNFNLKHMRGNPSPCCSLMGHHGIGVCGEWLNFVRRPGTIKSRLPLCNRPFPPSHRDVEEGG